MGDNYSANRENKAPGTFTPEKKEQFLLHVADGMSIAGAARKIGLSHATIYNMKNKDAEFAKEIELAREAGSDAMEDSLKDIGETQKNPTALIFLLKGRRPEIYREKLQADITNSDGSLAGLFAEAASQNADPTSAE